jgi:hypothetical protein
MRPPDNSSSFRCSATCPGEPGVPGQAVRQLQRRLAITASDSSRSIAPQKDRITRRGRERARQETGQKMEIDRFTFNVWAGQSFRFGSDALANSSRLPGQA